MATPRLLTALLATVALVGCASGPDADSLAAEPDFAASMPGASIVAEHAANPGRGIEGASSGYVSRMWVTDATPEEITSWHAAALDSTGWNTTTYPYISMSDGRLPEHAWRRGDLVISVGFPDQTNRVIEAMELDLDDRSTLYQTTITYQPDDYTDQPDD